MLISKQLINGFIQTELELFKKQFDDSPVPNMQEERSLAISWVCYYFKDSITYENKSAILDFVNDVYSRDNYCTFGWFRISALQAAAFILTSDIFYANSLIQHIGCGQGWARAYIIESAALICSLLKFDNQYLKKEIELNIKYAHFFYEESTILYLSTNGSASEKKHWLDQISMSIVFEHQTIFFNKLKKSGTLYQSGFFIRSFSTAKSYFLFKILSQPILLDIQPSLFDEMDVDFNNSVQLEKDHPLSDYYIDLSFLGN
jgi:hypothetical protein